MKSSVTSTKIQSCFRTLARIGGGLTNRNKVTDKDTNRFPSPLEDLGGSNESMGHTHS